MQRMAAAPKPRPRSPMCPCLRSQKTWRLPFRIRCNPNPANGGSQRKDSGGACCAAARRQRAGASAPAAARPKRGGSEEERPSASSAESAGSAATEALLSQRAEEETSPRWRLANALPGTVHVAREAAEGDDPSRTLLHEEGRVETSCRYRLRLAPACCVVQDVLPSAMALRQSSACQAAIPSSSAEH